MRRLLITLFSAVLAIPCFAQYATVEIETLVPPEKKINYGDKDVAIIAFHYYKNAQLEKAGGFIADSALVNAVATGIKTKLQQSPLFEDDDIQIFNLYSDTTAMLEPCPPADLQEISEQSGADIIYSVEYAVFDSQYEGGTRSNPMLNKVAYVVVFRVYDAVSGEALAKYIAKDEIKIYGQYDDGDYNRPPEPEEAKNIVASAVGEDLAARLVPLWETVERMYYYNAQIPTMRKARECINNDDWNGAVENWTNLLSLDYNNSIKAQAMYNLALGCEVTGNLDLALEWLNKCKQFAPKMKTDVDEYIAVINKRKAENKTLDEIQ